MHIHPLFKKINNYIYLHAWQDHKAWELMKTMCKKIGPRPAGSPAMGQARNYLGTMLEAIGAVDVREEEVPVRLWDPGEPMLELLEPGHKAYDCLQYLYTASRDLILPLVDVRNHFCSSSDYLPFMLEGIPAARPADWEDSFPIVSHTEKDNLSNVRVDWIQFNAMVYSKLLAHILIDTNPLPVRRLTTDEIREKVWKEDVTDNLRLLGFKRYA